MTVRTYHNVLLCYMTFQWSTFGSKFDELFDSTLADLGAEETRELMQTVLNVSFH